MKKTYILDTNILLDDPNSINVFDDCNIVIPFIVIEEMDRHKDRKDICGANARDIARKISEFIRDKSKELVSGIELKNNSTLYVLSFADLTAYKNFSYDDIIDFQDNKKGDNLIIDFVRKLKYEPKFENAILVSRDILLRIKCNALNIPSEDYKRDAAINRDETIYTGKVENISVSDSLVQKIYIDYEDKNMVISLLDLVEDFDNNVLSDYQIFPNTYVSFSTSSGKKIGPFRYDAKKEGFVKLIEPKITNYTPRNTEQKIALDMLMNPDIVLCSLTGKAGSGKTLLSIAAGLEQVSLTNQGVKGQRRSKGQKYDTLVVSKPVIDIGNQAIGFLPGTKEEKMDHWIAPIKDNIRYLLNKGKKDQESERILQFYFESGIIELEAITYMRGRSFANAFIIIDETQNCTLHELKTILTRVGENSKIVILGDLDQIDALHLDYFTNGLANAIEKFKTSELSAHVTLEKGERSKIATLASEIL
jgi:PhoH-like ATPase